MASIFIYNVRIAPPPVGVSNLTVAYKLASASDIPANYTIVTTTLAVHSNGELVSGPFEISGLTVGVQYTIHVYNACGGFKENAYPDVPVTTTTSTTTSTTSSTTTTSTTLATTTTTSTSSTTTSSTSSTTTTTTTGDPSTTTTTTTAGSTTTTTTAPTTSTTTTSTTLFMACPTLTGDDLLFYLSPKTGDDDHGYFRIFEVTSSPAYTSGMGLQELPVTAWFRKAADPDVTGSYTLIGSGLYYYSSFGAFSFPVMVDTDQMVEGVDYVIKIKLDCAAGSYFTAPFRYGDMGTPVNVVATTSLDVSVSNITLNGNPLTYSNGGYPILPGETRTGDSTLNGSYTLVVSITGGAIPGQSISVTDSSSAVSCQNVTGSSSYTFTVAVNSSNPLIINVKDGTC